MTAGSDIRHAASARLLCGILRRNRPAAQIREMDVSAQMHGSDDRQAVSADDASFECLISVEIPAQGTEFTHHLTSFLRLS